MANKPPEKRQDKRLAAEFRMNLVVFDPKAVGVIPGEEMIKMRSATARNISASGMCLCTSDFNNTWLSFLTDGTISLMIRFKFADHPTPITVTGRVIWVRIGQKEKYVLGVNFISIRENDRKFIAQLIASEADKH